MALSNADINRIWAHTHPTQMKTTDMRGFHVSTWQKADSIDTRLSRVEADVRNIREYVININRLLVDLASRP